MTDRRAPVTPENGLPQPGLLGWGSWKLLDGRGGPARRLIALVIVSLSCWPAAPAWSGPLLGRRSPLLCWATRRSPTLIDNLISSDCAVQYFGNAGRFD